MKIKYLEEQDLEENVYYYVQNENTKERNENIEIRQWGGNYWLVSGLGTGGKWKAIARVPELNLDKYKEK